MQLLNWFFFNFLLFCCQKNFFPQIFSLITAAGPELNSTISTSNNGNNAESARNSFLTICSMLIQFDDPFVKADATACYQHLHLFVPRFLDISQLVLTICVSFF